MTQWINPSHPMTLRGAVILGYISAFFNLFTFNPVMVGGNLGQIALSLAIGFGAFGTANNKKWGFTLLAVSTGILALVNVIWFVTEFGHPVVMLSVFNGAIFPVALFAAVVHPQSLEYRKVWFE